MPHKQVVPPWEPSDMAGWSLGTMTSTSAYSKTTWDFSCLKVGTFFLYFSTYLFLLSPAETFVQLCRSLKRSKTLNVKKLALATACITALIQNFWAIIFLTAATGIDKTIGLSILSVTNCTCIMHVGTRFVTSLSWDKWSSPKWKIMANNIRKGKKTELMFLCWYTGTRKRCLLLFT